MRAQRQTLEELVLHRRLYDRARAVIASTIMASRHDPDELLQEAFVHLLIRDIPLIGSKRFEFVIRDMAWNAARRLDRRRGHEDVFAVPEQLDDVPCPTSGRPWGVTLPRLVDELVDREPLHPADRQRAVDDLALLIGRDIVGFSSDELSERCGLRPNTINQRIRRRVRKLRAATA